MLSTREIRQRIRGITNIQQITRAMEMVAANRLRKAEARVLASRPYHEKMVQLSNFLASNTIGKTHYLRKERDVKVIRIVVITSDKGLCGAYNTNILELVRRFLKENPHKEISPVIIGKKGFLFFQKRKYPIEKYFPEAVEKLGVTHITELTRDLITAFQQEAYQELHLFFTKFVTVMKCMPTGTKLLPIEPRELSQKGTVGTEPYSPGALPPGPRIDYIFEPYAEEIFSRLFPKYLESCIRQALWESLASEYAARRVAMIAASENAEEIINDLTRSYNKARQAAITKELIEVVSGAEALLR